MAHAVMDKKPAITGDTTEYLLRDPENRRRLLMAVQSKDFVKFTWEEFEAYSKNLLKNAAHK